MKARRILIGCAVLTIIVLVLVVAAGLIAWKRMNAQVPPTDPATLIDEQTTGFASLRFESGNPWFAAMIRSTHDLDDADSEDILPLGLVWTLHEWGGASITVSMQPRGRMIGGILDFALWRAGTSGDAHIARFEHGGEGITSFPGTALPGHVFVRGNSVVWSSDPEGAKRSVDLMTGRLVPAGPTVARYAGPPDGHVLRGAVANAGGALARALTALPGDSLDLDDQALAGVEAMGFFVDTVSADRATGEVQLHFTVDTPEARRREIAEDLAARIERIPMGDVRMEASAGSAADPGTITLSLDGMRTLDKRIGKLFDTALKMVEKVDRDRLIRRD